jgi:hypothetical protein
MTNITEDIAALEKWFAERPVWVSPFDDESERADYEDEERRWLRGLEYRCDPDRISRLLAALKEAQAAKQKLTEHLHAADCAEALQAARLARAVELLKEARTVEIKARMDGKTVVLEEIAR